MTCVVSGDLDVDGAHELRRCVETALEASPRRLVLDLSGVGFIDSSGLASVVDVSQRAEGDGVSFAVVPGDGKVRQVLALTQVGRRLRILDQS